MSEPMVFLLSSPRRTISLNPPRALLAPFEMGDRPIISTHTAGSCDIRRENAFTRVPPPDAHGQTGVSTQVAEEASHRSGFAQSLLMPCLEYLKVAMAPRRAYGHKISNCKHTLAIDSHLSISISFRLPHPP